jgi:Mrp family chromosome partitioning ATPase/DUF971 family protein
MITPEKILESLKIIIDPDFKQDIVSLGFIQNIKINDGHVSLEINLTTPACPIRDEFKKQAEEAVLKIKGVASVAVIMKASSRTSQMQLKTPQHQSQLPNIGCIIAVSSCKGGVGKSTIAAHLAQELADRNFQVGLLDADIHGPSIPALFGLQETRLNITANQKLSPVIKGNLKIMSFGFLLGDAPAVMRGPIVTRYIQQLLFTTDWGNLDYLFIDMPPGTGDIQLTITQSIRLSGAVIVTTPQTLSLIDVARGILMFERVKVPILGLIENMAYFICDNCEKRHYLFGKNTSQILNKRFGIDVLAELPLQEELTKTIAPAATKNPQISAAVDHVIRAVGKISVLKENIPTIESDRKQIHLIWPDGTKWSVHNRQLRLSCQCAFCVNEMTGEKMLQKGNIPEDIHPREIIPLGNYALGITWSDGHSSGIYPYDQLKSLTILESSPKTQN